MYINYVTARDNAWRLLIRHKVKKLPVDVFALCKKEKIVTVPYSAPEAKKFAALIDYDLQDLMHHTDGFTVQVGRTPLLFWDDSKPLPRQRFTVAHELGHIFNGDVGPVPTLRNVEPSSADDPKETAANVFASRILAPACVLWALDIHDADEIAKLCNISITSARWRMKRLETLYEREKQFLTECGHSCFLLSPLERAVFKQFKRYIRKH